MKRKLSLLMVLMMVLTLVPVIPSSALGYDVKFSKIAEDMVLKKSETDGKGSWTGGDIQDANGIWRPAYNRAEAPTLLVDFPETKLGSADYDITSAGKFSVTVDPDVATFLPGYNDDPEMYSGIAYPGDSAGIMVRRVSPYTIEVEVEPALLTVINDGSGRGHKYVEVPFFIQAQGYGDIMLTFETHTMKGFPAIKTTKVGTIHKNSSTAIVEKVGNLARNNDIVETSTEHGRIKIVENTIGAWERAEQRDIVIRIDDPDFSFLDKPRSKAAVWRVDASGAITVDKTDGNRTIIVSLPALAANAGYIRGTRNQVVLDLPIRVARGTNVGSEVRVTLDGEVSPMNLLLAKYTDYAITLKAEKVLDVIAGQDIQNKYIAKVVVEEMIPGSLLDGRVLNVSLKGKEKEKDSDKEKFVGKKAAYQHLGVVKLERLRGTGDLNIVRADISNTSGLGKSVTVDKTPRDGYQEFDVEVNRGSNLPNNFAEGDKPMNRAMKWELSLPFVATTNYEGDLYVVFDGAGVKEQAVKVATVRKPVTFEIAKTDGGKLADLMIGKQHQEAPDLTIKEVEAGVLQPVDIIRGETNRYGLRGTGTQKNDVLSWGGAIVSGEFSVKEGDASIDDVSGSRAVTERMFWLKRKSSKPATFKLEKVKVTLDRTVPYGPYKVHVDAGNVNARHGSLTDYIETPEYFNVVTPYPEDKDIKTVFTIGEQKYVQTISGVDTEVTMDVAAQISENRTMLPVRYVAEALGAKVNYNPATRVATFEKDYKVVSLNIDADVMKVNGSDVKLDAKPMNENGRILLPIVSIAQAFGLTSGTMEDGVNNDIEWDAAAKTVTLFATKK